MFYIAGAGYLLYLAILILRTYSELRSMPYFDTRLKFLSFFMIFVMAITVSVTMGRFGFGVLEDNFVANLNTTYKSSAEFMCFYGLLNFYLYTMAYVYSPDEQAQSEPRAITKDNPGKQGIALKDLNFSKFHLIFSLFNGQRFRFGSHLW